MRRAGTSHQRQDIGMFAREGEQGRHFCALFLVRCVALIYHNNRLSNLQSAFTYFFYAEELTVTLRMLQSHLYSLKLNCYCCCYCQWVKNAFHIQLVACTFTSIQEYLCFTYNRYYIPLHTYVYRMETIAQPTWEVRIANFRR